MKPSDRRAATSSAVSRRPRRCSISSRSPISAWRCLRRAMPSSARARPARWASRSSTAILATSAVRRVRSPAASASSRRWRLALALAGLEGRDLFVDTLFIDEGFGALDSATLDVVIDALETLQGQGRRVGVISHVDLLQQRIATKICVERRGGGVSVVRLRAPGVRVTRDATGRTLKEAADRFTRRRTRVEKAANCGEAMRKKIRCGGKATKNNDQPPGLWRRRHTRLSLATSHHS